MLRVRRFTELSFTVALFASCSQLIGLDDLEPDDDEGSGGTGLTSGAGGSKGGAAGDGGKGGSTGGKGGTTAGRGGRPSDGGEGGDSSGGSAGDGGTDVRAGAGGAAGSGGTEPGFKIPEDCSEVIEIESLTPHSAVADQASSTAIYGFVLSPNFGGALDDRLSFQIYDGTGYSGAQSGTFEIEGGVDASYATCSRCLLVYEDDDDIVPPNFFAMGGTITVAADSEHMDGQPNITLSDVTLVESTILQKLPFTSTPIENARCLHIESAVIDQGAPPLPPVWTCSDNYWFDGYCDCGCGTKDIDCVTNDITECFNGECNCALGYKCDVLEPGLCVPE
jgi:hypothetical protein